MNQNGGPFGVALGAALILSGVAPASAQNSDGYWSAGSSGSWANSANWESGTIADGTDNTAYFGITLEPAIPASATFTLDGARTIGNLQFIRPSGPVNWVLTAGSGGPLTLDATFDYPGITVNLANQQVTISVELAGVAGLEKLGAGNLILTATNTYSGGTILSGGTLWVNGAITDPGVLTNLSGTLGGTGMISGPVVVQTGGILAPGSSGIGTLTIDNSLMLQTGSKTLVKLNASTLAHDAVQGLSNVTYGGTLVVSNLAGSPALGQSFQIFSAGTGSGNFSSTTPNPGPFLRWRFDPGSGVLSVISSTWPPWIADATLSATNFVLQVTNGVPGATNYVLSSTNLVLPLASWSRVKTNIVGAGGSYLFTNAINANLPQRYFRVLVLPLP
jgi:fibronectin-binding autotransporter adhesin